MNSSEGKLRQFPSGFLVALLLVASGLLWAALFFGPLSQLKQMAGGLSPFDIRWTGYSYDEARTLLAALCKRGRAYYLSPELIVDSIYPPLYATSAALAIWWLTMPGRVRRDPLRLSVRCTLIAIPITTAGFDLIENGCIVAMLWTWPDLSQAVVCISSLATRIKIMFLGLTGILMGGLALMWLLRWSRRKA
jgi:hypothetical protein